MGADVRPDAGRLPQRQPDVTRLRAIRDNALWLIDLADTLAGTLLDRILGYRPDQTEAEIRQRMNDWRD